MSTVSPSGNCTSVTVLDDGSAVVSSCNTVLNQTVTGGGGIADGDKGDITVSGSGATWTIDNSAVTYAKIQNVAQTKLIGRTNTSSGPPQEITVGSGLKLSGTTLSTDGVVSGTTTITAGTGLTGGVQALSSNVSVGVDFGTGSGKVCEGNDARLTDSRTPTTHKTSHATGGTDALTPADIGAAASSHTHAAADITSGTLALARGGTNLGSTPMSGQLLIGNGTGYSLATLTQGSGVTITNGSGSITIAATGGSGSVATDTIWDAAGDLAVGSNPDTAVRLARGSAGQVLTVNSGGTNIEWATPAGGSGTKTYAVFTPLDAQPPASNFATLDTHADIAVLEFDGGATNEETTFVGIMPEGASLGSGLKVRIHWCADTATSGNVRWGVQFQRLTDDIDAAAFDTAVEANTAAPTGTGADGTPTVTEITITTIDGIVAGDAFRLKVYRDASDTTNDTMSGDAQLIAVEVRSAA